MKKTYVGFCIPKIWQILKCFSRGIKVQNKTLIYEECHFEFHLGDLPKYVKLMLKLKLTQI